MYHKRTNRLVEICPQCCRAVDTSTSRLVSDACGHTKCRICLLQEINGCLKCSADAAKVSTFTAPPAIPRPTRKSVIIRTADVQKESIVKSTCQIIEQTLKPDILFPKEIAKESSSNFFHLKRLISQRFFSERDVKEDKNSQTDIQSDIKSISVPSNNLPENIQYVCNVHKITLTDSNSIEQHLTCSNDNTFVYQCSDCQKTFANELKLKKHSRTHLAQLNFKCHVCVKTFKDNYALQTHLRKHTGDKVFTCNLCEVKLSQLWSLKRHLAMHKGERNFVCEKCRKTFLTKSDLTRHHATHFKNKQFGCQECGARFTFQRSLARHSAIHNSKSLVLCCRLCDSTFKRKDNLHRHLRNTHSANESMTNMLQ